MAGKSSEEQAQAFASRLLGAFLKGVELNASNAIAVGTQALKALTDDPYVKPKDKQDEGY